jgi:hypothetical protein
VEDALGELHFSDIAEGAGNLAVFKIVFIPCLKIAFAIRDNGNAMLAPQLGEKCWRPAFSVKH